LFIMPPIVGWRSGVIVVHRAVVVFWGPSSFDVRGRCCSLMISWGGWKLLLSAHLHAAHEQDLYVPSIDDARTLAQRRKDISTNLVIGVGAQCKVGALMGDDNPEVVGSFGQVVGCWKGWLFVNFCHDIFITILHTQKCDPNGSYMCHYYLRNEARQIDYGRSDLPIWAAEAQAIPLNATSTDHRAIGIAISARVDRCAPKFIGWMLNDASFPRQVLDRMNELVRRPPVADDEGVCNIFCDGVNYARRRVNTGGWGLLVFDNCQGVDQSVVEVEIPALSTCGPLVTDSTSSLYRGASSCSTISTFFTSVVEGLRWLLHQHVSSSGRASRVVRRTDSIYA
jgi:hypothetical protein